LKDYDGPIGADTENSGTVRAAELWSGTHYATGFSLAYPNKHGRLLSGYFPWRHEDDNCPNDWLYEISPILTERKLIFHNAHIDMAAMSTLGIEIVIPPFDTTVMAHMCNEEFPSKKLDWLSKFILKEAKEEIPKKWLQWGWDQIPPQVMEPYARKDAELAYKLWKIFYREMQP
jgi:DNA polymerase I-like protein with 3'-5' exonuclease and polymerase domains